MVANTWIAAAPGDWSDDANWSLGHSPIAGEDPTFDGTSTNNCVANDDTPTGVLTIAAGYSGTITQASDMHITGYSQAGGTFTGVTTKWVYCSGNFVKTAGTITAGKLNYINIGINNHNSDNYFIKFINNGTINILGGMLRCSGSFINNGVITCSISSIVITYEANVFNNNGLINGSLTKAVTFTLYSADKTYEIKNISIPVRIELLGTASKDCVFNSLGVFGVYSLNVFSSDATKTITFNLNGHSLTATTITVGTRGILANSASTDSVVSCANFDSSAGTFTPDRTVLVMEGASTIKLAAGGSVDNLLSKGVTALASDVTVSNVCGHVNPISKEAFALTLTKPEQEYTGLKRPIIIPVKNLDIGPVGPADGWLRDLGAVI